MEPTRSKCSKIALRQANLDPDVDSRDVLNSVLSSLHQSEIWKRERITKQIFNNS